MGFLDPLKMWIQRRNHEAFLGYFSLIKFTKESFVDSPPLKNETISPYFQVLQQVFLRRKRLMRNQQEMTSPCIS
ncbi:hypothetical protein BGS_1117 [Beggiatoa sp. SS]|nr:hypothetical protein BGS_1117 [Beggiatoa sp. SS]